ncbi:MAG TPA: ATP synthase F1 subunit delta [Flavobacteriales bacterium]
MIASPVAYRYARSVFALAKDQGALNGVRDDMRTVASTAAASADLRMLLKSPVVKADTKSAILKRVFAGQVGELSLRFMDIMVRKGREALLPEVALAFSDLFKADAGIVSAEVTSAVPLADSARQQVQALVTDKYPGKSIEITEKVDPELIGGLIIRVGDEQFDGSVVRRLHDLRRKFSENPYIPEI